MKIAVVCALGWLDRNGYQYTYRECIGSMAEFADAVYLVQSTRNRTGIAELMALYPHIVHIADSRTWFCEDEDESSVNRPWFHNRNFGIGMQTAAADGAECIVGMHSNWYVPRASMAALRSRCDAAILTGQAFDWLYRSTQLAGIRFHVSHRAKFIVNPTHPECMVPGQVADKAHKLYPPTNQFAELDGTMVVDVPLEMPLEDIAAVWNFSKCYDGRVGGSTVFSWSVFRGIYQRSIRNLVVNPAPLTDYGDLIAKNSRADFVSHIVLRDAGLEHA